MSEAIYQQKGLTQSTRTTRGIVPGTMRIPNYEERVLLGGLDLQKQAYADRQAMQQQLLQALGLTGEGGGLLGNLFGSLPGGQASQPIGAPSLSQPGFPESPSGGISSPNTPLSFNPGGHGGLFGEQLNLISQLGQGAASNINRQFQATQSQGLADLQRRGLSGSTLNSAVRTGAEEARQRSFLNLQDELLQQASGAYGSELDRQTGLVQSLLNPLLASFNVSV